MLHIQEDSATKVLRTHDISHWQEISSSSYGSRAKKRFNKRKAAIVSYFTTNRPLEEIAAEYHLSPEQIVKLASCCLTPHTDGQPWGFRALLPGAEVANQTKPDSNGEHASTSDEETEIEATVKLHSLPKGSPKSADLPQPASTTATSGDIPTAEVPLADLELPASGASTAEVATTDITIISEEPDATMPDTAQQTNELAPEEQEAFQVDDTTAETSDVAPTIVEQDVDTLPEAENDIVVLAESTSKQIEQEPIIVGESSPPAVETVTDNSIQLLPLHRILKRNTLMRKIGLQRRLIRRGVSRMARAKSKSSGLYRAVSLTIVAVMILGILIPLGVGLQAYSLYTSINGIAHDGISKLMEVKDLLSAVKADPMSALSTEKLQHAKTSFKNAEDDFLQLQQLVDRSDIQSLVNQFSPDYAKKLVSAQHLVQVALDVSRMGQELTDVGMIGATALHGSPLADDPKAPPLISVDNATQISGVLSHTLFYLDNIQIQMSHVHLQDLPISKQQQKQLTDLLGQMPQIRSTLLQAQDLLPPVFWLLGVGHQRNFLIQTMDRGELRPSGGFTGQFGLLSIKDGRVSPFTLQDVLIIDYAGNDVAINRSAPAEYRNWMNFGNWGLRDSNLSPDYPTTANINLHVFQEEGGGPIDGDIAFTPAFISHILEITGPIQVGDGYNETITSQNLEERLHYYQQDTSAINRQKQITGDKSNQARKEFTSLVGKLLMDKVRHLPTKQLLEVMKNATKDLESHDLQVYLTDPTAQQWLTDHSYNGSVDSFTKHDGFVLNQANISISKASTMVHTTEHDDITLDDKGGAQHSLTVTLNYKQTGNVYGFDTYADYMRLYAPPQAQFTDAYGFDTGVALCRPTPPAPPDTSGKPGGTSPTGDNPPDDHTCAHYKTSFPSDARYCPSGNYDLGDRNFKQPWTIDSLGGPTSRNSDLPGHAMWGGLTVTPKNCVSTITFSWYVPNAVQHDNAGHPIYQILVQKQGGYSPTIELNVHAQALNGGKSFQVKQDITKDTMFSMPS